MEIFLPIAEMSVHWLVILGMGFGVGFLSGQDVEAIIPHNHDFSRRHLQ